MVELSDKEMGYLVEAGVTDYEYLHKYGYLSADDDDKLIDLMMNSLAPGQEMTVKADEIGDLLTKLSGQ